MAVAVCLTQYNMIYSVKGQTPVFLPLNCILTVTERELSHNTCLPLNSHETQFFKCLLFIVAPQTNDDHPLFFRDLPASLFK